MDGMPQIAKAATPVWARRLMLIRLFTQGFADERDQLIPQDFGSIQDHGPLSRAPLSQCHERTCRVDRRRLGYVEPARMGDG